MMHSGGLLDRNTLVRPVHSVSGSLQVLKKKSADADDLLGLSSAKRGGKKPKKGAEKAADKPASPLLGVMPT